MIRNAKGLTTRTIGFLLYAFLWTAGLSVQAQAVSQGEIGGDVMGPDGQPLPFATVVMKDSSGARPLAYALTDREGRYVLRIPATAPRIIRIVAEHMQMQGAECLLPLEGGPHASYAASLRMVAAQRTLQEVVVKAAPPSIVQKGDTIVYRAAAFADAETRKVEDLLRRMPGFQVSSDGRIHFNGREVDRILIDGDDLTERNYRLLSRSLQAGIVDKVEVLSDYHPDRLLGQVERSERVGINLRTDMRFRNRPTWELAPGIGTSGRSRTDGQFAWLSERGKALAFLDVNRTAGKPGIGLQASLEDESGQEQGGMGIPSLPIRNGRISTPSLESPYVRDNRDASAVQVMAARLGSHARLRLVAAAGRSQRQAGSRETNEFLTPDAGGWSLEEERGFREILTERSARIVLTHDKGGRHVGNGSIAFDRLSGVTTFRDRVEGAFHDSMMEQLGNGSGSLKAHVSETFQLPGSKVLRLRYGYERSRISQDFDITSGRWNAALGLASGHQAYLQEIDAIIQEGDGGLTLHGRGARIDWRLGSDIRLASQSYDDRLQYGSIGRPLSGVFRAGRTRAGQRSFGLTYAFDMRARRRWLMGGSWMAGWGDARHERPVGTLDSATVLYRAMLSMRRDFSPREKVLLTIGAWREPPSAESFQPERLDGESIARAPVEALSWADRRSLQMTYLRQDLAKARSMVFSLGGGQDAGVYVPQVVRVKEFARIMGVPSRSQFALRASLHAEAYVDALRGRTVSDLSWFGSDSELRFNGIPGRSRFSQLTLGQKWIASSEGWFRMECGWRSERMVNATRPSIGSGVRQRLWQHHGYVKAKADWEGRPFIAAQYARHNLAAGSSLGTLDLFASLQVGQSIRFSLTCHNLTGADRITLGSVGANERSRMAFDLVGRYVWAGIAWTM